MIIIGYLISTLRKAGPTNVLKDIVLSLDRKTYKPVVITLSPEQQISLQNELIQNKIEVISLGMTRLEGLLFARKKVRDLIKDKRINLLHSHGYRADLIASQLNKWVVTISTLHNFGYEDFSMRYGAVLGYCLAKTHYCALKRLRKVVACSETIQTLSYMKGLATCSIRNGVNTSEFQPVSSDQRKSEIRESLGLPKEGTVLVLVGDVRNLKNQEVLIKGFLSSSASKQNIYLLVVGDGPDLSKCKFLARTSDKVFFVGRVNDVKDYLQASDYFVSASLSEGMPISVLEALSVGLPVFLSNIPQHQEIANISKNRVFLFDGTSEQSIRDFFEVMTKNILFDMNEDALIQLREKLDIESMVEQYSLLYQKLLREERNSGFNLRQKFN